MTRYLFSPAEFDAACRELERLCPWIWQTSAYRSGEHNAAVGGNPHSKHSWKPCMAKDYDAKDDGAREQAGEVASGLGLHVKVHMVEGGNPHVHVQGLPKGPPPSWWSDLHQGVKA